MISPISASGGVLALAAAILQQTAAPPTQTFRSGIEVVELDVSVTRKGLPVGGLTADDFVLTDNDVAQTIESATIDRLPLTVTLLLDVSQSVSGERLTHLVQAGNSLLGALRTTDRVALITFSHAVRLRVPHTGDAKAVAAGLVQLRGDGATALRDAVGLAVDMQTRDASRPLILLFTDGQDTASWLTQDAALDVARRAGIVIHAVKLEADDFLERLTGAVGGRTWSATSDRQLHELFTRALEEMRARYLLSYMPRGVAKPGWHELKVKLRAGGADVTARPGYFVTAAR